MRRACETAKVIVGALNLPVSCMKVDPEIFITSTNRLQRSEETSVKLVGSTPLSVRRMARYKFSFSVAPSALSCGPVSKGWGQSDGGMVNQTGVDRIFRRCFPADCVQEYGFDVSSLPPSGPWDSGKGFEGTTEAIQRAERLSSWLKSAYLHNEMGQDGMLLLVSHADFLALLMAVLTNHSTKGHEVNPDIDVSAHGITEATLQGLMAHDAPSVYQKFRISLACTTLLDISPEGKPMRRTLYTSKYYELDGPNPVTSVPITERDISMLLAIIKPQRLVATGGHALLVVAGGLIVGVDDGVRGDAVGVVRLSPGVDGVDVIEH
eukprot:753492-Hanusia_phi.AAC.7